MQYRGMQIDDHDRLMKLWRESEGVGLRDSDSIDGIRVYLERNPGLCFVAEQDGEIVGTIMAGHDGKRGYIQHLAVTSGRRGNGIGSRLIELCLEALKRQGILKSHVHVYAANATGRRFWSGRGWIERDELVTYSFVNGANPNV